MMKLSTVNKWNQIEVSTSPSHTALEQSFDNVTLFQHIYIPVKTASSTGMPDHFTYEDIGVNIKEMSEIYNTYFGKNYWVEPLVDTNGYSTSVSSMNRRILSVYRRNLGKYKKLIELAGYSYNPLWNVDGTEEYAYLENQGTNDTLVSYDNVERTDTFGGQDGDTDTQAVTTFDSNTFQNNTQNTSKSKATYGAHKDVVDTRITHHNAKNGGGENPPEYSGGTDVWNNVVVGGDKYHTEKRVRSGNIGVTKTQELIESERVNLRFSILEEFFKDINEEILVGIYF